MKNTTPPRFRDLNNLFYGRKTLKEEFIMLFEMTFKVVEIREGGVVITHYLKGSKHDVKKDIEAFKTKFKKYEMFGNEGMVVWA